MIVEPVGLYAIDSSSLPVVDVGEGCTRIDLPGREGARVWIVDMAPGAVWPWVDEHDTWGEGVFVAAGELIEGEQCYGPGTYLDFGSNSSHRPRTETGVRLFGFNVRLGACPRTGSCGCDSRGAS